MELHQFGKVELRIVGSVELDLQLVREFTCGDFTHDVACEVYLPNCDDCAGRTRVGVGGGTFSNGDQEMTVGQKLDAFNVICRNSVRKCVRPENVSLEIGDDDSFAKGADGGKLLEPRLWRQPRCGSCGEVDTCCQERSSRREGMVDVSCSDTILQLNSGLHVVRGV